MLYENYASHTLSLTPEGIMDKKIKKVMKKNESEEKDLKSLLKADKKQDAKMQKCDMKMMKKKK